MGKKLLIVNTYANLWSTGRIAAEIGEIAVKHGWRDSLGTWFTGGKKQPEQPESKPTVKAGNGDCLVGASRYRMGQMRTHGDLLGHLSKGVDSASIFVPESDETVTDTPAAQAIDTEFEMEFETENTEETDVSANEIETEEIACLPDLFFGASMPGCSFMRSTLVPPCSTSSIFWLMNSSTSDSL